MVIFAFGYSMMMSVAGYGADRGIIPMACERIFERMAGNNDPDLTIRVEASMLEIYMEKASTDGRV
jgi:kinesin family protein 1